MPCTLNSLDTLILDNSHEVYQKFFGAYLWGVVVLPYSPLLPILICWLLCAFCALYCLTAG
ncbi:hypothetical protein AFK20_06345 [Enhydrobacter aerosaccus]|uniref:Uncharacterized protein n=1 Tax=Enhydrobacter aerosaccus TaxID=225324 RepID=A0ABR5IM92_9HYPH|nr:hypothetical protein AFK20_06345 [Enhydrobacter aerosaccus]